MTIWHVPTDDGWTSITSDSSPDSQIAHRAQQSCFDWECGWVCQETAKILDRDKNFLFEGSIGKVIEWVIANPVKPHMVDFGSNRPQMSIDRWLTEVDLLIGE